MNLFSLFNSSDNKNIVFNNDTLRIAVKKWLRSPKKAERKYGHISTWDTSQITDMSSLFENSNFNGDINMWDVSNVKNMSCMFAHATLFNQSINNWNVSNVKNMRYLFYSAKTFNQPLDDWNVCEVSDMSSMFSLAMSFNQPINDWNVSNVKNMSRMFEDSSFNQPIQNWDVSNVKNMSHMFYGAKSFNQPLNKWNVKNVETMESMFCEVFSFNQPLDGWNISGVKNISYMFYNAKFFHQSLEEWDVSNVEEHKNIFSEKNMVELYGYNGEGLFDKSRTGSYNWKPKSNLSSRIELIPKLRTIWNTDSFYESGEVKMQHRNVMEQIIEYRSFHKNGNIEQTWKYQNKLQFGEETEFDENGNIKVKRTFSDGKQNGETTEYFENGNIHRIVNFNDGKAHGKATTFFNSNSENKICRICFFDNGNLNGPYTEYFENNNIKRNWSYKKGQLDGEQISYYENGQIREKGFFVDDMKHGKNIIFTEFGMIAREIIYKNGEILKEKDNINELQSWINIGDKLIKKKMEEDEEEEEEKEEEIFKSFFTSFYFVLSYVQDSTDENLSKNSKEENSEYSKLCEETIISLISKIKKFDVNSFKTKHSVKEALDINYYFSVICIRAWNHIVDLDLDPKNKYDWQEYNFEEYFKTFNEVLELGEENYIKALEPPLICFIHIYNELHNILEKIKKIDLEFNISKNIYYKCYELLLAHTHAAVYAYFSLLMLKTKLYSLKSNSFELERFKRLFKYFNLSESIYGRKMDEMIIKSIEQR